MLEKKHNFLTCGLNFSDNTRDSWGRKNTILTNHQLTNLKNKINNLNIFQCNKPANNSWSWKIVQ